MSWGFGFNLGAQRFNLGGDTEASLLDAWRFAEWEEAVWARVERDYIDNAPIVRGAQIFINQDAGGDASGGGGTGTESDPYLCDTWDDVCDLLMLGSPNLIQPDTAIIFNDGDYYEGTHQLELSESHMTVCTRAQYAAALMGEKEPAPSAKFFVNHFTIKIPAASSWTNSATDTYYIAEPTRVYTIRKQTERLTDGEQFRILNSEAALATLAADQRGFWYDTVNGRVYVKVTAGEDPEDFDWECVDGVNHATNADSRKGTIFSENGTTGIRISGMRSDGFGFTAAAAGQFYAVKTLVGGDRFAVVNYCEGYFNNRHNMGCNESNGFGGTVVYKNCDMGLCYDITATMFVSYNAPGGNNSYCRYINSLGVIRADNQTRKGQGRALFTHAGAGNAGGVHYWFDINAISHEFGVADMASNASTGFAVDDDPPFSQYKNFFVRHFDFREDVGTTGMSINSNNRGMLNIGHKMFTRPEAGATSSNSPAGTARTAVAINCTQVYDLQDIGTGRFGMYNSSGTAAPLEKRGKFFNCFIAAKNIPSGMTFCGIDRAGNSSNPPPSTTQLWTCRNTIFAKLSGAGTMIAAHGNNANQHSNNAYFDVNLNAGQISGYDNVVDYVDLTTAPDPDRVPEPSDEIYQAGNRPPRAYEDRDGARFPTPPDIGTRSSLFVPPTFTVRGDGTPYLSASVGGGIVDTFGLTYVQRFYMHSIAGTQTFHASRNARVYIVQSSGVLVVQLQNSSGANIFQGIAVGALEAGKFYMLFIAANNFAFGTPRMQVFLQAQNETPVEVIDVGASATGAFDFTDASYTFFSAHAGADRANMSVVDFWVTHAALTPTPSFLQQFMAADGSKFENVGTTGGIPTSSDPTIYLRGPVDGFGTNYSNLGDQGNFTPVGSFTQGQSLWY